MSLPRRVLCGAVDIKDWSKRPVPEQIRAQQSLITVVYAACREAGLPEEIVQSSGDGVLIMPPSGIDETAVIPDLVRGLVTALRQENRLLSEAARIRLRLALTNGMVSTGPTGFSGPAIIECFRLLDSPPVKTALVDFPMAGLAVIVSDHLYHDVIKQGFRDLDPEDFRKVRSSMPERGFSASAWVWVSGRRGGESGRTAGPDVLGPASSASPAELAEARSLAGQGDYRGAIRVLEALTRTGDAGRPALVEAHLELGRLERLVGRPSAARDHLAEAAGLIEADGHAGELIRQLLELSSPPGE